MKIGDEVFFAHSNYNEHGIVGIMETVNVGYPDFLAFDPQNKHYDPKCDPENTRWFNNFTRVVRSIKNIHTP